MKAITTPDFISLIKSEEIPDIVTIFICPDDEVRDLDDNEVFGEVTFTQDNYDLEGKIITYGNKRTGLVMEVETEDRYKSKEDVKVCIYYSGITRNDITYQD